MLVSMALCGTIHNLVNYNRVGIIKRVVYYLPCILLFHLKSMRKLEARKKKFQVVDLVLLISQDIKFTYFMHHNE